MPISESPLARRQALENRYDGPLPRQRPPAAPARLRALPVVAALARRRDGLPAAAVAADPVLVRISAYLGEAVMRLRLAEAATRPAD